MNVLYENHFRAWLNERFSAAQRWDLDRCDEYQHAKMVCMKETDREQFFFWLKEAKREAIHFLFADDIEKYAKDRREFHAAMGEHGEGLERLVGKDVSWYVLKCA